jgi:hypothetical protein
MENQTRGETAKSHFLAAGPQWLAATLLRVVDYPHHFKRLSRLLSISVVLFPLILASHSMAGASTSATQSGQNIIVANEYITITFSAANGSIISILDNLTQTNLLNGQQGADHQLWGLGLSSGATAYNAGLSTPSIQLTNSSTSSSVTFVWSGLNFNGGPQVASASATVTIKVNAGDPMSHWTYGATGLGGINATSLSFPNFGQITVLGSQGSDNQFVLPDQDGRLTTDPIGSRLSYYALYPSARSSMQFIAYYNSSAGFIVASHDTEGQTKAFALYAPQSPANVSYLALFHYFPDQAVQSVVLPYEVVVGVFHGDWTTAADLYKNWALQQWWVKEAASKYIPSWLNHALFGRTSCAHKCGEPQYDLSFAKITSAQAENLKVLGAKTLLVLQGWEHGGDWFTGDYFPPYEGWTSFDNMVASLHKTGNYLILEPDALHVDATAPIWMSGEALAGAALSQDGQPILNGGFTLPPYTHTFYQMNPASDYWQQQLRNIVTTMASHKVDVVHFDTWPVTQNADDYSPGHPPGKGGTWQWQAWQTLMPTIESAGVTINKNLAFSSEQAQELMIPYVAFYDDRDAMAEESYATEGAVIPLFGYVYKPYVQAQSQYWNGGYYIQTPPIPDSYDKLVFARAMIWGQISTFGYYSDSLKYPYIIPDVLNYFRASGRMRGLYSRFLIAGKMLPSPQISSPSTPVVSLGDFLPAYSGSADSIQASAWTTTKGEIGVIMTNISPDSVTVQVPIDFTRWPLQQGKKYRVTLNTAKGKESLGTISGGSSFAVTFQPEDIDVITIR